MSKRRRVINGPEILLSSGSYFNLLHPERSKYTIEDIAHGLANCCRFVGQCREHYSVAQHSVYVASLVPQEYRLAGLLHDASEAVTGDLSKPMKELCPDYKAIENRIQLAMYRKFLGSKENHKSITRFYSIHEADMTMLATERRDLMPKDGAVWPCIDSVEPLKFTLRPWESKVAETMFLWTFDALNSARRANRKAKV